MALKSFPIFLFRNKHPHLGDQDCVLKPTHPKKQTNNLRILKFYPDSMPSFSSFLKSIPKVGVSGFYLNCKWIQIIPRLRHFRMVLECWLDCLTCSPGPVLALHSISHHLLSVHLLPTLLPQFKKYTNLPTRLYFAHEVPFI